MNLNAADYGSAEVLFITGEIRGIGAMELCKTIEKAKGMLCKSVVLDLGSVTYIDDYGIGGLIYAGSILRKSGKNLVLASSREKVVNLFRDCPVGDIFTTVESFSGPGPQQCAGGSDLPQSETAPRDPCEVRAAAYVEPGWTAAMAA